MEQFQFTFLSFERTPINSKIHRIDLSSIDKLVWRDVDVANVGVGPVPPDRVAHSQASVGPKIFVFGGRQGVAIDEKPLNDFYSFDTETNTWTEVEHSESRWILSSQEPSSNPVILLGQY